MLTERKVRLRVSSPLSHKDDKGPFAAEDNSTDVPALTIATDIVTTITDAVDAIETGETVDHSDLRVLPNMVPGLAFAVMDAEDAREQADAASRTAEPVTASVSPDKTLHRLPAGINKKDERQMEAWTALERRLHDIHKSGAATSDQSSANRNCRGPPAPSS